MKTKYLYLDPERKKICLVDTIKTTEDTLAEILEAKLDKKFKKKANNLKGTK